ncbi:TIGR04282 family arsenosugar biosynthesis glycosyltransferase [Roseovarius sp. CH_XMU1461]|uniref:TIGR04282 family arsenosugar biosynthesis glycosyltransferase n=1 Tax=Roseovarius sp. CH_XMU1461 TaxID=3107777 RepID=UPI00300984BD
MRPHLYLMLKEPRPGRVKTRLGREIGMVGAACWFRQQIARACRELDDPRWQLVLAVAPDRAGLMSRMFPPHLPRVAQGQGDLGARMARLLRNAPPGPAAIVGGDVPGVRRAHVARAFAMLGRRDAVFGPADDGGYWLVGLKRSRAVPATLFDDVRWSSANALEDSIRSLGGLRHGLIDQLRDVDGAADMCALTPRAPQTIGLKR